MRSSPLPFVRSFWSSKILPTLSEYIAIPCLSPAFDANWAETGHIDRALALALEWIKQNPIPGAKVEVGQLDVNGKRRTPVILMEIPGDIDKTVLLYGHLDKQPPMEGWRDGLSAFKPVREGDLLYGRGAADDGYALFASVAAIAALREQGVKHAKIFVLIELSEESGSPDLPAYVEHYAARLGDIDLVVCLDSGAGSYDRLWCTTSLRGLAGGSLRVDVLREGVHSGSASGVVPDSMRIARALVSRLEDESTGKIKPEALHVTIPESRLAEAKATATALANEVFESMPWTPGMTPVSNDPVELLLNRTWRPALAIIGADGLPSVAAGGNVLRPFTTLKLSLRIPPTLPAERARDVLMNLFTKDPPYGATITASFNHLATGWNAPELSPWLSEALNDASIAEYEKPALSFGEGGTIPFMGMLGERFPRAQFIVTGVLGPSSNAHGPNEFLHVPYAERLTACVARLLARHATV